MSVTMRLINDWRFLAILCATIGLAPYHPEPHLWGKLKWVAGGAVGMQLMDWFDLILHGSPWVLMGRYLWLRVKGNPIA